MPATTTGVRAAGIVKTFVMVPVGRRSCAEAVHPTLAQQKVSDSAQRSGHHPGLAAGGEAVARVGPAVGRQILQIHSVGRTLGLPLPVKAFQTRASAAEWRLLRAKLGSIRPQIPRVRQAA